MDTAEPVPTWSMKGQKTLLDCGIFRIEERRMVPNDSGPPGGEADFYILRTHDWVNVVALTHQDELILIEQWRQGVRRVTLEIPGGIIDPGEAPFQAATRELAEETGYTAPRWHHLFSIEPNPAIQDNRCHTFLALDAVPTQRPDFDEHEYCRVVLRPWSEVPNLVANGQITHSLVAVALFKEQLRRAGALDAPQVGAA